MPRADIGEIIKEIGALRAEAEQRGMRGAVRVMGEVAALEKLLREQGVGEKIGHTGNTSIWKTAPNGIRGGGETRAAPKRPQVCVCAWGFEQIASFERGKAEINGDQK